MPTIRTTNRWRGVVAVALFAAAVGVFGKRPDVLLCAVVGVVFTVYSQVTPAPVGSFEIERTVSDHSPRHDEQTEVTVAVRNVGDTTIPDLRLVDGVPPMLPVTGGSPRHATFLRPGESTSFSYEVTARHGTHRFEETTVIARDISGMQEVETTVSADTEIECHAPVPEVPLRARTNRRSGRLPTKEGGSGIEFHQTREYRRGDPASRIDWNRYARSGELTTVEFREERTATVVLCLDARPSAYRGRDEEPHAVSYGVAAAQEILTALLDDRHRVGLAAFGRELLWLGPGAGREHGTRFRHLLATHPTLSTQPPGEATLQRRLAAVTDGGESELQQQASELRKRLDAETQTILFTPLADDAILAAARSLESGGTAVTVVSPDVTTSDTVGGRLARVERANRVHELQGSGVPVVDWETDEPLGTALLRATEGWST